MPPRVMGAQEAGNGFQNFIESMPPITRAFAGTVFCGAAATYVGILNPFVVALVWPAVLQKYQVWRLVTCHTYMPFGMSFVFMMLFLIKYGGHLESEVYRFNPADYLFMLLFGAAFLSVVPPLVGFPMFFTTVPLIMMIVYVWSRNFPETQVSLYGLVTIQAFYLPFAFLFVTVIMGGSPVPDLFGIAAGHLWYFFTDLYPRSSGRQLLKAPAFLRAWLGGMGVGPAPSVAEQQARSAFRGRGQRLGAS